MQSIKFYDLIYALHRHNATPEVKHNLTEQNMVMTEHNLITF